MAHPTILPVQPSTYNHPCGDLLDGGRRREYLDIAVPLYRASIKGDQAAAEAILQGREHLVRYSITENKETPLHVAAGDRRTEFVRYLVNMMNTVDLELQNRDGNTAFCVAAISGNVDMVKIMFEKNQALPIICGSENKMPLYLAAFHGNRDVMTFLYDQSGGMMGNSWTNDNRNDVLLKCIQASIFDVALRILGDNEELPQDKHVWDVLQVLARNPWAFHVRSQPKVIQIKSLLALIGLVTRPSLKESDATLILRLLWKRIMERPKDVIDELLKDVLFIAAKMGNTKFLVELIREYPDLIRKTNDDGQSIFHISVSHRNRSIYSLLYDIGSMKDLMTPIKDKQGNNLLHLAGKNPEKSAYNPDWMAAPYKNHSETVWYKEVWDILPPPCREVENNAGQTPQELFREKHKDLASQGMKWINETINQSMVVAALVCTIGFSIVFQVPGGFDQNNGFPILQTTKRFTLFIVIDAFSFIMSASSIVIFLSIVLSRSQENTDILLRRWVFGQLLLLTSIIFIILAFVASLDVLYPILHKNRLLHFMYQIGSVLVIIYCVVYLSLFKDVIMATYTTKVFKRKNNILYGDK